MRADHALCGAPIALAPTAAPPAPAAPIKKPKKGKKPAKKPKAAPPPVVAKLAAYALPEKATHLAFDTGACIVTQKRLDCFDSRHACKITRPWPAFVTSTTARCLRATRERHGALRCARMPAAPLITGVANAIAVSATATHGCALAKEHQVLCWEGTGPATAISFSP